MRKLVMFACCGTLLLTSCGGERPAKTGALAAAAQESAKALKSGQVDINTTTDDGIVHMRFIGSFTGGDQEQQQTLGSTHGDGILVGGKVYLKGDSNFWLGAGVAKTTAATLNNKWWVGTPVSGPATPALNIDQIISSFFSSSDGKKLLVSNTLANKTTTSGIATYTLTDPTIRDGATLVITRDKSHALVQISNFTSSALNGNKATYTFSHLDDVQPVTAPQGAQPIAPVLAK